MSVCASVGTESRQFACPQQANWPVGMLYEIAVANFSREVGMCPKGLLACVCTSFLATMTN